MKIVSKLLVEKIQILKASVQFSCIFKIRWWMDNICDLSSCKIDTENKIIMYFISLRILVHSRVNLKVWYT